MIRFIVRWLLEIFWREWQLVGTFDVVQEYDKDYRKRECHAYIHCFESRWGSRRIQIIIARTEWFNGDLKKRIRLGKIYQTEVYPWLNGRMNTKIPSFFVVKSHKWDFMKSLRGETPVVLNDDEKDK